uniref:Uncharacterized protein n=1 Tax=Nelumbo nucifera TaxID=4432 RepID=A0A822Y628_NELNU|nr:TPA_asm: hypothetical protein HUJ06_030912 [Nelumbo nucifera]
MASILKRSLVSTSFFLSPASLFLSLSLSLSLYFPSLFYHCHCNSLQWWI